MRLIIVLLPLTLSLALLAGCAPEPRTAPEVTLKLGGQFCESYADAVKSALMQVEGVKAVDLESTKGHAVVTGDPGAMKVGKLKDAVDGVKGEGWYCEATVVK